MSRNETQNQQHSMRTDIAAEKYKERDGEEVTKRKY